MDNNLLLKICISLRFAFHIRQCQLFSFFFYFLIFKIYFRGVPNGYWEATPSYFTCSLILFFALLQYSFLYIQAYYGCRSFFPKFLFPNTYNYFVKMPNLNTIDFEKGEYQQVDCAICMNSIYDQENQEQGIINNQFSTPFLTRLSKKKNYVMECPCRHKFHIKCLIEWMAIKMECPTCRHKLPPIQ